MGDDTTFWVFAIAFAIVLVLFLLCLLFWLSWRGSKQPLGVSPYTGLPLRRATDMSYQMAEKVLGYLYDLKQYDNRTFRLKKAAFCRDTGRIFQDCVTLLDNVHVDWTFLQKRFPGTYVSWGSLTNAQQKAIIDVHESLGGFQTVSSSPSPSPRAIESEYAYATPGPLYVDFEKKVLLGWKQVPGTDFEVLIVQRPIR